MQDFIFEIIQSVLVVIIGFIFSKLGKKTKTLEQIEAKAEQKKLKYIKKHCKKNNVTPHSIETSVQESTQPVQKLIGKIEALND